MLTAQDLAEVTAVRGSKTSLITLVLPGQASTARFGAFLRNEKTSCTNIKDRV